MANTANSSDPLENALIWRALLQRLTGHNPIYDWAIIESFAEACEVDPKRVWLKLKPQMFSGSATALIHMADDTPAKKPKSTLPNKWARQKPKADPVIETRRRLWEALHKFISDNGGWIVSPKHSTEIRIEVPEQSNLPGKLTDLGYRPLAIGQCTRLTPKAGSSLPWVVCDIITISLPGK